MAPAIQLRLGLTADDFSSPDRGGVLSFSLEGDSINKHVRRRSGSLAKSSVRRTAFSGDLAADFDLSWLRSIITPGGVATGAPLRVADLFAGAGAMSLGLLEACRALQIPVSFEFSAELDSAKADVYSRNLAPTHVLTGALEQVLNGDLGALPTRQERELIAKLGRIDVLLGGPPCQGHSDLNNHTRRNDIRNGLVTRMARFAELFTPEFVVVENVQGVRHDRLQSASATATQLRLLGYNVEEIIVDCALLGVPQTRRRYMLVASLSKPHDVGHSLAEMARPHRPTGWAIEDLLEMSVSDVFNTEAIHAPENERRIKFLFENDLYDLPDSERPNCHRTKNHSYKSVYGRMRWDQPSQTITTGFGSTGQGRFVHPLRPRTLTPHEAARLQTIPDFFKFGEPGRTQLQKMIGNSVPPLAMAAVATQLLR
ncbi:DNA cytosine methyltransferase [Mesorhizobium dulcispinae]|uniref:DNA cytosine methyltransferase n=1 Tax=Mesorhizobium dulcispinae TaxID=3072316 RepID=UPI002A24D163|nr:DNA cytosine methyltransferase [Mesorhizobium sp. VK23D]MDX8518721.1 DNA cytosine methyltransferase [Mesorhizobium sp. VK23D]